MAKKPVKGKFENDSVSNAIIAKYGDIIEDGNKVLDDLKELKVISVSPALDIALGGGFREGSCVVMTADPKHGKTTTALHFASKCQKLGKNIFYYNTEGRLTKENFIGIKGLDPAKIKIVQSSEATPLVSAETFLNSLEAHIKGTPDLVAIVDSVSSMVPQDELDGEVRTGVRNALPKLLAMFLKRISGDVHRSKAIIIFITHNIANTGGSLYAPKKMADSGNMLQYQAGTNMIITHRGKWEVPAESGNHVGQIANWSIKTSAAGGKPNSTAESWIRYGVGIDEIQEIAQIASEFGLVKKAGAWYTLSVVQESDDPQIKEWLTKMGAVEPEDIEKFLKFQGMQNLLDFLNEHEFLVDFIYGKIKEILL